MKASMREIDAAWNVIMDHITHHIQSPRREKLLQFYKRHEARIKKMPASYKLTFHSAYEGGYVIHVGNVLRAALKLDSVWRGEGAADTWTTEELVFAAINHDLGKMGDEKHEFYIPNPSDWHVKKQGAIYTINPDVPPMPVPDRSLFLLQQNGIEVTYNEMVAIKTHDGLYSEGNKEYLMGFNRPNSSLCYLIHQADIMASRIEWEQECLIKPKDESVEVEITMAIPKRRTTKKELQTKIFDEKGGLENFTNALNNLSL